MTPELFQQVANDPTAFQAELIVPAGGSGRRFGDIMADFQRERFAKINPALVAVANGERPEPAKIWLEAVKGNSKTSDLACIILWLLAFTRRPLLIQVGAADADQAAEIKKAAADILRLNAWLAEVVTVQSWQVVCQRTGSTCDILAADVAGSHGARPDVLILDEVVHVTRTEFLENLLDNASKIPHCLTIVATNAGHMQTWAWRLRELARASSRWFFHQRTEPAPWSDPAEMEEARRRNTPARYSRLWKGVWSSGGDALDANDLAACKVLDGPRTWPRRDCAYFAGLDLSSTRDHSALVLLEADGNAQKVRVADCRSWAPVAGKIDLQAVRETTIDLARRFAATVHYDPSGASLLVQDASVAGVWCEPMQFASGNLHLMASSLLQAVREHRLELYDDQQLLDDLQRLNIVEKQFGFKLEASRDKSTGHCDRGIALAIALPHALACLGNGPSIVDYSQMPVIDLPGPIMGSSLPPGSLSGFAGPPIAGQPDLRMHPRGFF